jgi:hypothetical protein
MSNERVNLKLRFVNKEQFVPFRFNTHRGNLISLEAKESVDVNFGIQKNVQSALDFYGKFKKHLEVIWLDKPQAEKSIKEDEQPPLEPEDESENQEDLNESDEDEESPEFTREELEALNYAKLVKLAKKHGVPSKKKDEIIEALLGE